MGGFPAPCHPERSAEGAESSDLGGLGLWGRRLACTIPPPSKKCGRDARTTKPLTNRPSFVGQASRLPDGLASRISHPGGRTLIAHLGVANSINRV